MLFCVCACVENHLHVSVNIVNKMFSSFSVSVYTFHCDKHRVSIPRGELIQKNVYKDEIDALNVSYIHTCLS